MSIHIVCKCGKQFRVAEEHAGKKGRCPACGEILTIPAQAAAPSPTQVSASTTIRIAPVAAWTRPTNVGTSLAGQTLGAPSGLRGSDRCYLALMLVVVPLLIHTFGQQDDIEGRVQHTMDAHRQVFENLQNASLDELLSALPDRRIEGAAFGRDTWAHWLFGGLSAMLFFALATLMLRSKDSRTKAMLIVGLFTGTLGILLLLGFQYIADFTQGFWMRGGGILTLLFYIVKFIGFSYRAASDPSNGFWLSLVGFTFGVGFCEELCKALPLMWHFRKHGTLSWRGACVWGLVSGVGFGVAEGILYSAREYNGVATGGIYWVRFVSCAGLHAVWAAAAGVSLFRHPSGIQSGKNVWEMLACTLRILAVPMLLHGVYDTLLKQGHDGGAFVAALVSLGWLAFQIEKAGRQEQQGTLAQA
jgi:RsiW-degrading membrane proteinase PrsW (M82 family)